MSISQVNLGYTRLLPTILIFASSIGASDKNKVDA